MDAATCLENATCNNTCEYGLTGQCLRVKLLWFMSCNTTYALLAVEKDGLIYKAYVFGEDCRKMKQVGDIFYVKFGRTSGPECNDTYFYKICDEHGTMLDTVYNEKLYFDLFVDERKNKYERPKKVNNKRSLEGSVETRSVEAEPSGILDNESRKRSETAVFAEILAEQKVAKDELKELRNGQRELQERLGRAEQRIEDNRREYQEEIRGLKARMFGTTFEDLDRLL